MKKFFLFSFFLLVFAISGAHAVLAHGVDSPGTHTIHITDEAFEPRSLEIEKGDTVIFENTGTKEHWPASNIHPTHTVYPDSDIEKCDVPEDEREPIFDACRGILPGETWSFQFNESGTWQMHDHLSKMSGEIIVRGEANNSEAKAEKESFFASFKKNINAFFYDVEIFFAKFYFRIFPERAEAKLSSLDFLRIADNEEGLAFWLRALGYGSVIGALIERSDEFTFYQCHPPSHKIGRKAYQLFGSDAFQGRFFCAGGNYHGAMEAFLTDKGTEEVAGNIEAICLSPRTPFEQFECLHGSGHGIMAYMSYDLPQAVAMCGELETEFARESCYGGAFMENLVAAAGAGALPGHETEWVSRDIYYPCNAPEIVAFGKSAEEQCYLLQASRILELTEYSYPAVTDACNALTQNMRHFCFRGYGYLVAASAGENMARAVAVCEDAGRPGFYSCVQGLFDDLFGLASDTVREKPHLICQAIGEKDKDFCYETLGKRLTLMFGDDLDKIKASCELTKGEHNQVCRQAAGVPLAQ